MANDETRSGADAPTGDRPGNPDGETSPTTTQVVAHGDAPLREAGEEADSQRPAQASSGDVPSSASGSAGSSTPESSAGPESAAAESAGSESAAPEPSAPDPSGVGVSTGENPPSGSGDSRGESQLRSPWAPSPYPAPGAPTGTGTGHTSPGDQPTAVYPGTAYPPTIQSPPAYPTGGQPNAAYAPVAQPGSTYPPGAQGPAGPAGAPPGFAPESGWAMSQPTVQIPAPTQDQVAKTPWRPMVIVALVAALLAGAIGGVLGYKISRGGMLGVLPGMGSGSDTDVEAVSKTVLPSVVQLRVRSGDRSGAGSGIVLTPDGLLLTNNHVIETAAGGAGQITALMQDGSSSPATIIGRDPSSDIALVKASSASGLTPIQLGNSDAVRVGQQVLAVGSPLGLGGTVTSGIVSALNRAVSVGGSDKDPNPPVLNAIQTDAAINPGNSGGALVDIEGRLVGINSAIASVGGGPNDESGSVGLGFAIPINQAKRIADELQRTGQATKPVLGVMVERGSRLGPINDAGPLGAKLTQVTPDSPAAKAGLKSGDIIVKVNDRTVTYGDELVAAIRALAPGQSVALKLSDGRTLSAVLDGQPVPATK